LLQLGKHVRLGRSSVCEVAQMLILPVLHLWQHSGGFKRCCLSGLHAVRKFEQLRDVAVGHTGMLR
jgi:hypothetical protein